MPTHSVSARPARGALDSATVDASADAIGARLEDAAHFPGGRADGLARPASEAAAAALIAAARTVLPIGAQSSVTGGATPAGGLVLSTERLVAVSDRGGSAVAVGAGVSLDALQRYLDHSQRWYPPVPTFTGASAGGVVATNAAGAATFKYGTTRAWVDGLVVVLACGCVLDVMRGQVVADGRRGWEIACAHGVRRVVPGGYRMPAVPKCSAGYYAAPDMDLVDLFVGSEGTLGLVTEATLRVRHAPPARLMALVPVTSDAEALGLVGALRRASEETWRSSDPAGIDIAAVEYLDRRSLELLREDGVAETQQVGWPAGTAAMLILQVELPEARSAPAAFDELASARAGDHGGSSLVRLARLLDAHSAFDVTEVALPGDARRMRQFLAFREGAPAGVNRRVGRARRDVDGRIDKTAADMVVPFDRLGEMLTAYHEGFQSLGLDYAIWGHVSDGNLHPNVIPRSFDDVARGRETILGWGRLATSLGGSPLAEHGVGRSALKQALLRELYGEAGVADMVAIKQALDPEGKFAPGVLFPVHR
jgi:D-lactate dehydrogenase (cytochrome)